MIYINGFRNTILSLPYVRLYYAMYVYISRSGGGGGKWPGGKWPGVNDRGQIAPGANDRGANDRG